MAINKVYVSRSNSAHFTTYVGEKGHLFYDPVTGQLRISDGHTPGGIPAYVATNNANIGNLSIFGTTISTLGANQDMNLVSNGTGNVNIIGELNVSTTGGAQLIQTLQNGTMNFYVPNINSFDSAIDIIGSSDGSIVAPQTTGVMLHITGQDGSTTASRIYNDGVVGYAAYIGRRYNGSSGSPSAVNNGELISRLGATPYTSTGWPSLSTARIDFVASQDQTGTNQGSNIQFWTTAINSNSVSRSLTIDSGGITFADATTQSTAAIPLTQLGAASGVATLDGASRLTLSQIPTSLLGGVSYQGTWNANTNVPTLANGVGTTGYEYAVTTGGTNLGSTFVAGDWVIYNGATWDRIPVGGNGVTTFNTRTGAITLSNADVIGALAASSIQNVKLQNSTVTVNSGTGVTGGGTVSLGSAITVSIGQDVSANATPTFAGINLTADSNIGGNLTPSLDNTYYLGSETRKWKSVYIGPGSIYIQDTANAAISAELTVTNGVLQINGANQLQVGQLKFVDNTIESITGNIDIQIGYTGDTGNLVLNRNVVLSAGKTLNTGNVAVNGTFSSTKGITHNATQPTLVANVVPINFDTDDLIHVHTTGPGTTLTANLINLATTIGKTVEVLVMSPGGGSTQFNHGVASSQSTNANSFFLTSHQSMYVKYFNFDGTTGNLFVTAIGNNTI